MIYSKKLQRYIPVSVEKIVYKVSENNLPFTRYIVKDGRIPIGRVDLSDVKDGVYVQFIENFNQNLYGNFGRIADQIEVEHCIKRNLKTFKITSEASLNSHALHYLRGKRFIPDHINEIVKNIIEQTPDNETFNTKFLKRVKMYMPQKVIQKYIDIIKSMPLLSSK